MLKEYHYDHLIRWPRGERAAVVLTFDFQGGEDVKQDKNGILNYEMWSQGEYGPHHAIYRLLRILKEELVIVAVPFPHLAVGKNRLDGLRKTLDDRPAGQERRLDVLFLQNPQQPIDCMVRTVFTLAPHFVVENAVLVRLHVLAALEIEGQKDRGPLSARPMDEMVVVIFLEHGCSPVAVISRA